LLNNGGELVQNKRLLVDRILSLCEQLIQAMESEKQYLVRGFE
jgi:hypothetical protein